MFKSSDGLVAFIKKYRRSLQAAVFALLPLLCCMVAVALEGHSLSDVYLPASEWNDELFYFKQVEGILNYGYPQGYFGFNESHALKLSFAAWSPVLVFPWILWGLIFGWSLLSPIYCNIFLMMLAVFLFVYLVQPKISQLVALAVMFLTFTPLTRFTLSVMPEIICISLVIVLLGLALNYEQKEAVWKLAVMFALASLMALMRPYLIVFMIFPVYAWVKRNKLWAILGTALILSVTGGIYIFVNHYLGAEYFAPLFDITWLEKFLSDGLLGGVKYTLLRLWNQGTGFISMMIEGCKTGMFAGTLFDGFVLMMVLFGAQAGKEFFGKEKKKLFFYLSFFLCFFGMFVALLLMYKLHEGGRHLITFITAGIFVLSLVETKIYKRVFLTIAIFLYLYVVMAVDPYEYQIPYRDKITEGVLSEWTETFEDHMVLSGEEAPSFDNVIIWTFSDLVEGKSVTMKWQELYAMPKGFGISCSYRDYVEENFENLKSKYLAVPVGGNLDNRCRQAKMKEIGQSKEVIIYALR